MLDKIILKGEKVQMSDDEFFAFCQHTGFQAKLPADPVLPGFSLDLSKLALP